MSTGLLRVLRRDQRRAVLGARTSPTCATAIICTRPRRCWRLRRIRCFTGCPPQWHCPSSGGPDEDVAATCDRRSVVPGVDRHCDRYRCRQAVRRHPRRSRQRRRQGRVRAPAGTVARLAIWRVALLVGLLVPAPSWPSRGRPGHRAAVRTRPGRVPVRPPVTGRQLTVILALLPASDDFSKIIARGVASAVAGPSCPGRTGSGDAGDRRTGIETHPRSTRVGSADGIPADARSGNRVKQPAQAYLAFGPRQRSADTVVPTA